MKIITSPNVVAKVLKSILNKEFSKSFESSVFVDYGLISGRSFIELTSKEGGEPLLTKHDWKILSKHVIQ